MSLLPPPPVRFFADSVLHFIYFAYSLFYVQCSQPCTNQEVIQYIRNAFVIILINRSKIINLHTHTKKRLTHTSNIHTKTYIKQWHKQGQILNKKKEKSLHSRLCCRLTVPLTVLMRCWWRCARLAWHERRRQRRMKMMRRQMTMMRKTETTRGMMIPTLMGLEVWLFGTAPSPVHSVQLKLQYAHLFTNSVIYRGLQLT